MKKLLSIFALCLWGTTLSIIPVTVQSAEAQVITDSKTLFEGDVSAKGTILKDYTTDDSSATKTGSRNTETKFRAIAQIFAKWFKRAMIPIAIGLTVWGGVRMILSRGNEEQVFTDRKNEVYAIATGFLIFAVGQIGIDKIFFGFQESADGSTASAGTIFDNDGTARTFAKQGWIQIEGVFDFVTSFIIVIATLFIVITCIQMVLSFGSEDSGRSLRERLLYSTIGLILVTSIKYVVQIFTGGERYGKLQQLSADGTNSFLDLFLSWGSLILGFLGVLAVAALIWAGALLIGGFGSDERKETAKKIVMYVIIGLIIAFSAFTIISFIASAKIV